MTNKIENTDKPIIIQHDTGVEVRSGSVSTHLGHNGLINVTGNGKSLYTGTDQKQAGEVHNTAVRVNRFYGDD
jgi:hypothetical protein